MKTFTIAQAAHYAQSTTTLCTCWRATLRDGTVITVTDHDKNLTIGGITYYSAGGYSATDIKTNSAFAPDNLEVSGFLVSPSITEADVYSGRWDYANIVIFEANWADLTMATRILRTGTLGEVKAGRTMFKAELRGLMQALTRTIVRVTTKECDADLGDARCKVNLATYTVTGTIGSVTNNRVITDAARTEALDWYTAGKITFTSGLNNGLSMEIKKYTVGSVTLEEAMPFALSAGDTYSMYAGCLKRAIQDCKNKFGNISNFRGFPSLPGQKIYSVGGN